MIIITKSLPNDHQSCPGLMRQAQGTLSAQAQGTSHPTTHRFWPGLYEDSIIIFPSVLMTRWYQVYMFDQVFMKIVSSYFHLYWWQDGIIMSEWLTMSECFDWQCLNVHRRTPGGLNIFPHWEAKCELKSGKERKNRSKKPPLGLGAAKEGNSSCHKI